MALLHIQPFGVSIFTRLPQCMGMLILRLLKRQHTPTYRLWDLCTRCPWVSIETARVTLESVQKPCILSTNFDPLLETAFQEAQFPEHRDLSPNSIVMENLELPVEPVFIDYTLSGIQKFLLSAETDIVAAAEAKLQHLRPCIRAEHISSRKRPVGLKALELLAAFRFLIPDKEGQEFFDEGLAVLKLDVRKMKAEKHPRWFIRMAIVWRGFWLISKLTGAGLMELTKKSGPIALLVRLFTGA